MAFLRVDLAFLPMTTWQPWYKQEVQVNLFKRVPSVIDSLCLCGRPQRSRKIVSPSISWLGAVAKIKPLDFVALHNFIKWWTECYWSKYLHNWWARNQSATF